MVGKGGGGVSPQGELDPLMRGPYLETTEGLVQ